MFRLLLIVFALIALSIVPFLIWGAQIEENLSRLGAAGWMQSFGRWAWAVGIGQLDLIGCFHRALPFLLMKNGEEYLRHFQKVQR